MALGGSSRDCAGWTCRTGASCSWPSSPPTPTRSTRRAAAGSAAAAPLDSLNLDSLNQCAACAPLGREGRRLAGGVRSTWRGRAPQLAPPSGPGGPAQNFEVQAPQSSGFNEGHSGRGDQAEPNFSHGGSFVVSRQEVAAQKDILSRCLPVAKNVRKLLILAGAKCRV